MRIDNTDTTQYRGTMKLFVTLSRKLQTLKDAKGGVVGFQHPDGRVFKPIMAFEVENPDGTTEFATSMDDLESLGVPELSYESIRYYPWYDFKSYQRFPALPKSNQRLWELARAAWQRWGRYPDDAFELFPRDLGTDLTVRDHEKVEGLIGQIELYAEKN